MAIRLTNKSSISTRRPSEILRPDLVVTEGKEVHDIRYEDLLVHHRDGDGGRWEYVQITRQAVPLVPTTVWGFHQRGVTWSVDTYTASATFVAPSDKRKRASRMGYNQQKETHTAY